MNKFLIEYNYDEKFNAGSKARDDVMKILNEIGYRNIILERPNNIIRKLFHILNMKRNLKNIDNESIILIEWPLASKKYMNSILNILEKKRCKKIALIHDITQLRNDNLFKNEDEIEILNKFDVVITHNRRMTNYLIKNNLVTKYVELDIFDYLYEKYNLKNNSINKYNEVVFAGNLAKEKSGFLYNLNNEFTKYVNLNLFGANVDKDLLNKNIKYFGTVSPEELPNRLNGFWGLVWDGNSIDKCDGILGEYLKYNNPHKASLYLSAGIPVIVWKNSAISEFVYKNEVGLVIENLNELKSLNLNKNLYEKCQKKSLIISEKIKSGYYVKKAVKQCEKLVCR